MDTPVLRRGGIVSYIAPISRRPGNQIAGAIQASFIFYLWGLVKFHTGGDSPRARRGQSRCNSCADGRFRQSRNPKFASQTLARARLIAESGELRTRAIQSG